MDFNSRKLSSFLTVARVDPCPIFLLEYTNDSRTAGDQVPNMHSLDLANITTKH